VPKKRRKKKFTATKAVKSMARTAIGSPPPVQREESRKRFEITGLQSVVFTD